MSFWALAKRSLVFYWRTNVGVLLAVAVSTAVLTGALVVGDSVRHSLMMMVQARLGNTQLALVSQNRFFRAQLADDLTGELKTIVAPVLQVRGLITSGDEKKQANNVQILGVDERFFRIGAIQGAQAFWADWSQGVVLNEPLAQRLGVKPGNEIKLRIEKPGLMPREVPLTPDSDLSVLLRPAVKAVADDSQFGRFGLQANQIAPLNVFVPIRWLQENLGHPGGANLLLVAGGEKDNLTVEQADAVIEKCWRLADTGLELGKLNAGGMLELRSSRIFIDDSLSAAATSAADGAVGILTYFVNELRLGDKTTPYSTVTAIGAAADGMGLIAADMKDDEILINQWLADDLGAKAGDSIEIAYFIVGPMRKLVERKSAFTVRKILPMDGLAVDPELMPDFPGLSDVNNCRDWEPGIEIDLDKIRQKDEAYWDRYRGTPKAFVTLKAGRDMWANRYGNLTAVRYPSGTSAADIERKLLSNVTAASIGLYFQPVRALGTKAGGEGTYFGWLFLGMSFFLIIAAVILTGLLFVFGVESRNQQVGTLLAVGLRSRLVGRLLLIEGLLLSLPGAVVGTAAALLYTKAMIYGLSKAISGSTIHFYAKPLTLIAGALAAVVICLVAIWLTLRKQVSRPARELLSGPVRWQFATVKSVRRGRFGLVVAALATAGALILPIAVRTDDPNAEAGVFFGSGTLLLTAGLALTGALLRIIGGSWNKTVSSLAGLAMRNSTRRSGRSLAVVALLACGIFLVIAVEVFRQDPLAHADRRDSGTGGFTLFGESSIGILHDLNTDSGRKSMVLDGNILQGVAVVQMRVREGDDASCFNLNRAQRPRLLGVQPGRLSARGSFRFTANETAASGKNGWDLLAGHIDEDVLPAVGDYATIKWALGKSVGDEIEYRDEKGRTFRVRLVGMLENCILQGSLLIAEDEFIKRFPSEDGYRLLLIDTPQDMVGAVAGHLSAQLADFGLDLTSAKERLAAFSKVENTYLSIFQILGGLGLILGSVGLGLVVLRNMLERRNELAMLQAVGFNKSLLVRMVFSEHSGLLLAGLVCGTVAALVAASPALRSPGASVPYVSLGLTVCGIAISGMIWVRVATMLAISGRMLDALRNE